jgi:uncharacterized protein YukE
MSLHDLRLILNKEAIIATYPAEHLRSNPEQVELVYRTHAKTHIPLGDTTSYVGTIFKWVGGSNRGAFIGAVIGDYGHGKTSFQVHVWDESIQRRVFAVPPFSWRKVADIVEGVAAWADYVLRKTDVDLAFKASQVFEKYREKSIIEAAERIAEDKGRSVVEVIEVVKALQPISITVEVTPESLLNYCSDLTSIVKSAGFSGLLVSLDEPEVAAGSLSSIKVSQILFDIANGLIQRQDDFGFFISIPENFLASTQRNFSALPARLQARNCTPRLRDLYGPDFAQVLWSRFVAAFDLDATHKEIALPETLAAIGQIGSSERRDLSYGPRTVVSALSRMVRHYQETKQAYCPEDLARDCLGSEIMVTPDYTSRIHSALNQAKAAGLDLRQTKIMSVFPSGITSDLALSAGISPDFLEVAKHGGLVDKKRSLFCLTTLRFLGSSSERDELRDAIEEIFNEFAPRLSTFQTARDAFAKHIVPIIFESREGQQLLGWEEGWLQRSSDIVMREKTGAFKQTVKRFPRRKITVAISLLDSSVKIRQTKDSQVSDLLVHFAVRWNREKPIPERRILVSPGDPSKGVPGLIRVVIDLAGDPVGHEYLDSFIDADLFTPLGILNLIGEMDRRTLSHEHDASWNAIASVLVRDLTSNFLTEPIIREQAAAQGYESSGGPADFIGTLCSSILRERYPNYSTLIVQPRWMDKVGNYLLALQNQSIPFACKRGREPWTETKNVIAQVFNTNVMNLSDSFNGYGSLIDIQMGGRRDQRAEVLFKVHPLESEIRELIMATKPSEQLIVDGKECWWVEFSAVEDVLLSSGYQLEEIKQVVEIGKHRGSFDFGTHKNRQILYCKPLDPEQMQFQLREKLAVLKQELAELSKLPLFQTSYDLEADRKSIEEVQDDAQFDTLSSRMERQFHQNRERLPEFFDRLGQDIDEASKTLQNVNSGLSNSRQIAGLQTDIAGASRWCADLAKYIVANLRTTANEITTTTQELIGKANTTKMQYAANRTGSLIEKVTRLQDGWKIHSDNSVRATDLYTRFKELNRYLDDYERWRALLRQSDELYNRLLGVKKDESIAIVADKLMDQLEDVWGEISHHLSTRNIQGLGSYNQFPERFRVIDDSLSEQVRNLKATFDKEKETINKHLENLCAGGQYRVTETYNPLDTKGSYGRLFRQTVQRIGECCNSEMDDLSTQRLELLYERDIIGSVSDEVVLPVLSDIDLCETALGDCIIKVTDQWIRQLVDAEQGAIAHIDTIEDHLAKARDLCRKSRTIVRETEKKESGISSLAEQMLGLIPPKQTVDLKQLVIVLMEQGDSSTNILDRALETLSELFRTQKINIRVELSRRHL